MQLVPFGCPWALIAARRAEQVGLGPIHRSLRDKNISSFAFKLDRDYSRALAKSDHSCTGYLSLKKDMA